MNYLPLRSHFLNDPRISFRSSPKPWKPLNISFVSNFGSTNDFLSVFFSPTTVAGELATFSTNVSACFVFSFAVSFTVSIFHFQFSSVISLLTLSFVTLTPFSKSVNKYFFHSLSGNISYSFFTAHFTSLFVVFALTTISTSRIVWETALSAAGIHASCTMNRSPVSCTLIVPQSFDALHNAITSLFALSFDQSIKNFFHSIVTNCFCFIFSSIISIPLFIFVCFFSTHSESFTESFFHFIVTSIVLSRSLGRGVSGQIFSGNFEQSL